MLILPITKQLRPLRARGATLVADVLPSVTYRLPLGTEMD